MPKPVLQALVLADHVYQDKETGKMVIAGTFNRLVVFRRDAPQESAIPGEGEGQSSDGPRRLQYQEICQAGSPWAYVSLTELRGTVPLELRYVDLSDNVVMLRAEFSVKSNDPLETKEVMVPLPVLPRPHPGTYALELLSNGELVGSHRITIVEMPSPDQKTREEGA